MDKRSKRILPIDLLPGPSVPVWRLATQEFCELKVDLELRHPEVETRFRKIPEAAVQVEAMDLGKEFHADIASEAVPILAEEIPALIRARQPFTLAEFSLHGNYKNIPIIGRPDAIHFNGTGAAWVVEHKVRENRYVTPSDDAQLRIYAYLIEQETMFAVKKIFLVCLLVNPRTAAKFETLKEKSGARFERLIRPLCTEPTDMLRRKTWNDQIQRWSGFGRARVVSATFAYDRKKVREELKFLSGYWLGRREPIPTTKATKCEVCRVNAVGLCPVKQTPYRGIH